MVVTNQKKSDLLIEITYGKVNQRKIPSNISFWEKLGLQIIFSKDSLIQRLLIIPGGWLWQAIRGRWLEALASGEAGRPPTGCRGP